MALQTTDYVLIVLVIVLLFGATAIPKLARSLGRAQGEFNKAKKEFTAEVARGEAGAAGAGAGVGSGAGVSAPGQPSEEQVRRTARELGIDEAGKPLDEVKRLIAQKMA